MNRPFVGVAIVFIKEGKLLLGKRKNAHGEGCYAPPGGFIEAGESPEQCAIREAMEETALTILSTKEGPWIYYKNADYSSISLFIYATSFEGEPTAMEPHKCGTWEWFPLSSLPLPLFGPLDTFLKKYPLGN